MLRCCGGVDGRHEICTPSSGTPAIAYSLTQLIEVQTGSYLGEDDIERIEDARD